jgi:ribose-phosphate pyrophosphokinase
MELIITIDAAKRSGAQEVNVIIPMFPYARQDRVSNSGCPISGRVVCDMLNAVNPDRVVCFDLHADQIQGFMGNKCQFDHIPLTSFLSYHLKRHIPNIETFSFCAPDAGAIKRTSKLKDMCGAVDMCFMNKIRTRANVVDSIQIIGDVEGKNIILVDDIIDTGNTILSAIKVLRDNGANNVKTVFSHGIFSSPAYSNLNGEDIYVTDTMCIKDKDKNEQFKPKNLNILPIKNFLLELISCINEKKQLGTLFKNWSE